MSQIKDDNDLAKAGLLPDDPAEGGEVVSEEVDDDEHPGDEWAEPIPLTDNLQLPGFPTHVLPEGLRDWVQECAKTKQVPEDLPAMVAIGAVGACTGNTARIRVQGDHVEPPNIYLMVALASGARKTAVVAAVRKPLSKRLRKHALESRESVAEGFTRKRIQKRRLERAIDEAAEAPSPEDDEATSRAMCAAKKLQELETQATTRLLADDVTPEKLAQLLCEQKGNCAIIDSDCDLEQIFGGRRSRGSSINMSVVLKAHSGEEILVDRISRESDHVENPCLTLVFVPQPIVVENFINNKEYVHRGLTARFLYSLPQDNLGYRDSVQPAITQNVRARFEAIFERLLERMFGGGGPRSRGAPTELRMDREGLAAYNKFADEVETMLRPDGPLGSEALRPWGSKLAGHMARIAALLHIASWGGLPEAFEQPVALEWVQAAIVISRYCIVHARQVYGLSGLNQQTRDALAVLAWLKRSGITEFARRESHIACRSQCRTIRTLQPALTLLEEHEYIRLLPPAPSSGKPGRRRGPCYAVNPLVHAG